MCSALWLLTAPLLLGQAPVGTLHVVITDKNGGKEVPALVCITSVAEASWRVPPDGTIVSPHAVTGEEQIAGWAAGPGTKEWTPVDPGPVRVMISGSQAPARTVQRGDVHRVYGGLPAMPFWNEPVGYFVAKPFTIKLPPGRWRLAVCRGLEYLPVFEEFAIAAEQKLERKVELARWVDMPRQGWYSGDPEFHNWRDQPWRNDFILAWAQAADIHMTSVLSYNKSPTETGHPQMGYGKDFRFRRGDYALASGHEGPRAPVSEQGHLMQLNTTGIVRDTGRDHLMGRVCDIVHEQGGLCGYAHLAWSGFVKNLSPQLDLHPIWDTNINTIRGKIDFMEILQYRNLGVEDYYDFLNMGVKLTALAASDVTGGMTLGESRTYVYTGGTFSPDAWYAGVKQGRTFVTNGPMLTLMAENAIPGSEVRVGRNAKVRVRAVASAPEAIGAPKVLEILSQGRVIHTAQSSDPKQTTLTAEFTLPVAESQWIAARTTSFNAAIAHTSPVYLVVDGMSFADKVQLPQLVQKRLRSLDFIEKRLRDPEYITRNGYSALELPELLQDVEDARSRFKALLKGEASVNGRRRQ
jgi:hypothetical protein